MTTIQRRGSPYPLCIRSSHRIVGVLSVSEVTRDFWGARSNRVARMTISTVQSIDSHTESDIFQKESNVGPEIKGG